MIRPSRIINSTSGEPYLRRWHIIPRNKWFNVYLHHIVKSDDDRALHDHPWASVSILLKGELSEVYRANYMWQASYHMWRSIPWLRPVYRSADFAHRLVVPDGKEAWTLFITGRRVRTWGFYCPKGWEWWVTYTQNGGCGERD